MYDIGPDFRRRRLHRLGQPRGRPPSGIYGMERRALRNYDKYVRLYERLGKYVGGVPGFD